ncbi:MAG: Trm112 family protein [Planctomycetes bacterium]|nr:Trm112 family protein [Planctomycetota bacterium]
MAQEETQAQAQASIPQDLLEILVCPLGKAPLRLEGSALVCTRCGLTYAIEDGIPNMLIDEARLPAGVTDLKQLACYPGEAGGR